MFAPPGASPRSHGTVFMIVFFPVLFSTQTESPLKSGSNSSSTDSAVHMLREAAREVFTCSAEESLLMQAALSHTQTEGCLEDEEFTDLDGATSLPPRSKRPRLDNNDEATMAATTIPRNLQGPAVANAQP